MTLTYRGKAGRFLSEKGVEDYDLVLVETDRLSLRGRVIPRPEIFDDRHLVIKLDNGYNVGISIDNIKNLKILEKGWRRREPEIPRMEPKKGLPYVPMVVTGGTISSRVDYRTGGVRAYERPEELLDIVPEIADIANIDYKPLFAEFSENLTAEHWVKIAEAAAKELNSGASGVLVAHGTDTMHYSAAAVSFLMKNLRKPVVFVGAQRSIDRPSTDAVLNLIASVRVATSEIGEVVIVMHGSSSDEFAWVIRGVKARKMHTSRRDAFLPINSMPIAKVTREGIEYLSEFRRRDDSLKVEVDPKMDDRVFLLYVWPGMDPEIVRMIEDLDYHGLVVAGTGLGHTPYRLIKELERLVRRGIPVVMTSQTLFGRVNLRVYETGRLLLKAGVIPGEDMLPEVALVKLMYVLGHTRDMEEVRRLMTTNIAGEISRSISMKSFPPCWVS